MWRIYNKNMGIYRFPVELFYEPDEFKSVNKIFNAIGGKGEMGLEGKIGHIDVELDSEPSADMLEDMRLTIQQVIASSPKDAGVNGKLTVKPAQRVLDQTVKPDEEAVVNLLRDALGL